MTFKKLFVGLGLLGVLLALGSHLWGSFDTISDVVSSDSNEPKIISDLTYWPEVPNVLKNRTQIGTESACMYMLVRNFEVHEALESIRKIEDRFNRRYRYPWVFLNDEPFSDEFKILTAGMVSGGAEYGLVDAKVWNTPDHINATKYEECLEQMTQDNVIYGSSKSYRNMCRFNSGNFFWHPLMMQYKWYWRVEPGIDFFCDQRYDPFTFMRKNNKVYGFVITFVEVKETVASLFKTFQNFLRDNEKLIAPNNALNFLTNNEPLRPWITKEYMDSSNIDGWNSCHFWSNFEIGSLDFFRSDAYTAYFNYLDLSGGFYYERWGDAPVHSMGVLALANKSQIHHFSDIGYYHPPYFRCPHDDASFASGRCLCPQNLGDSIDLQDWSCLPLWWKTAGKELMVKMDPNVALYE